ncbi:hypothetical protein LCGC14_1982350 [marine sediment metagenome]|uniref:Uncharacterized protein n=2 Tax=root TaxID=1 RepID=A0A831QPT6_9FLAO|nr:hypothetical protein [Pricia antarctica]
MIYFVYNNFTGETLIQLFCKSDVESDYKYGRELKPYAEPKHLDYELLIEKEAIRHLNTYTFIFRISKGQI